MGVESKGAKQMHQPMKHRAFRAYQANAQAIEQGVVPAGLTEAQALDLAYDRDHELWQVVNSVCESGKALDEYAAWARANPLD
jgi:hypothetical protein